MLGAAVLAGIAGLAVLLALLLLRFKRRGGWCPHPPAPLHGSGHPMPRPEVHDGVRAHWAERIDREVRGPEQLRLSARARSAPCRRSACALARPHLPVWCRR